MYNLIAVFREVEIDQGDYLMMTHVSSRIIQLEDKEVSPYNTTPTSYKILKKGSEYGSRTETRNQPKGE